MAKKRETVRANLEKYTFSDGKWLYLIGEGRLVNLAAAEGHSSEVMDLSFSDQALTSEYLAKNAKKLKPGVHEVPSEIDEWVAKLKLETLGAELDILTPDQKRYLESWQEGT